MKGKEKWFVGLAIVAVFFLCLENSVAIKNVSNRSRKVKASLNRNFYHREAEIKKAFQNAEKNFRTSEENFQKIGERLDRMEQEILNTRGDLLKAKSEFRKKMNRFKNRPQTSRKIKIENKEQLID